MRFRESVGTALLLVMLPAAAWAAPIVRLSWEAMPGASDYDIEIALDETFASPVVQEAVSVPSFDWAALPQHDYVWRVRCRYSFGRTGEWSAVRGIPRVVFPVSLAAPLGGQEIVCDAPGTCRVTLSFETNPALAEYRLELTREADTDFLAPTLDLRVTASPVEWIPDDTGEYRWRVSAVDVLGRPVAASSERRLVIVEPREAPVAPEAFVLAGQIVELAELLDTPIGASPSRSFGPPHAFSFSTGAAMRTSEAASDYTPVAGASRAWSGPFTIGVDVSTFRYVKRQSAFETWAHAGVGKSAGPVEVSFRTGPLLSVIAERRIVSRAAVGAVAGVHLEGDLGRARWFVSADVRVAGSVERDGALVGAGVRFR